MKHLPLLVILAISGLLAAGSVSAQSPAGYPTRPIRMVVPFAPGGASDFVARIIQPKLGELLGQQIVIENRPGAAGNLAVEVVAHAAPDGYTVLLGNVGTMAINPTFYPDFKLNILRDFIGVTAIADIPGAIAIHPSIPAATIKDFIAYAKARPGLLNYGSSVVGSAQSLSFEFFMSKAGIKLVHIAYKGGAGAATVALISGEVMVAVATLASFNPYLQGGRLKVIGVQTEKRLASLPDIPTLVESGFPELKTSSWNGLFVPAGTPKPIVDKLYEVLIKVLNDPRVLERFAATGAVMITNKSPEDFAVFIQAQNEFWGNIVRKLGIKGS
jgi:tripartite-type tricarboxylate transporter receptor subunit TctC